LTSQKPAPEPKRRRSRWRKVLIPLLVIAALLGGARLAAPSVIQWYVNRIIDENPLYDGAIGHVEMHLWRGAYSIHDVHLSKVTGNVPVPLFAAKRIDLAIQWDALLHARLVGRVELDETELNFVDAEQPANRQSGADGAWLGMIRDLFPFKINRVAIHEGAVHFRAYYRSEPVDVYLNEMEGSIENLTNVYDETTPLIASVKATALAMEQARVELEMKFDPFSYWPTFELALRVLGLDVTKLNSLARSYGQFDFEHGYFSLVVELTSKEGSLQGYVKPLFRDLKVLSLSKDLSARNPLQVFWEALLEVTNVVFKNQRYDQLATLIPVAGELKSPKTDLLETIGNLLRNAFVRAYLPRLEGVTSDLEGVQFGTASAVEDPVLGGNG
jgi:hypothetical protein